MSLRFRKSCLNLAVVAALGLASPAFGQSTSSSILGQVQDAAGNIITDATITIVHVPSNTKSTISANESGRFTAKGLRVGGPYTVTVKSPDGTRIVDDVYLSLGKSYELEVELSPNITEEVLVLGTYKAPSNASGPSSSYGLYDLQNAPAVNRDLKDVIRLDPRIYIDENNGDSIQCGGANPRFNSLTVDGVRLSDNFGLNSNGYPTERAPFPFGAISQVAVELAPYDVQYGGFSACNINAVTKSGSNELTGSFYFDYTNDSLTASSLEGDDRPVDSFNERRYGFTVGGPILEDKLFFFVAADKLEGIQTFDRGVEGSNAITPVLGVTQADVDNITRIANGIYGYDPGGLASSIPVEDDKLLLKLDWNIAENQRASFTYNYNDGFTIAEADDDDDELEFRNHLYKRQTVLKNYVAQVFSDWSDTFSTEFKLGYSKVDSSVSPLGGTDFGEVQINVEDATVYLGADDSRHANKLKYDTLNLKLAGTVLLDNHTLTFGFEHESLDVFNLFVQEAEGEYRFASIADFEAGTPSRIIYESAAFTNDANDAAQSFVYDINTAYIQDRIEFDQWNLSVIAGFRYDWYSTSDKPTLNQEFTDFYGFSNQATVDGLDLLQPRLSANWAVNSQLDVYAGIGLYSGGNPNVWLSNNYANNGVTQLENQDRSGDSILDPNFGFTGDGRPIFDIPQSLYDLVAAGEGRLGGVNFLDPDFELPSTLKYSIGTTYVTENDVLLSADLLYSENKDAAIISDVTIVETNTPAPDGRPTFERNGRTEDFMLTNVDGDSGSTTVLSLGVSKSFDNGFDVALGYAYTDANDVNPMTSSVAFSNYTTIASANPENPGVATSNYEIPHRITLKLGYSKEFFAGYTTNITAFGSANEGRPYSYTFQNASTFGASSFRALQLLYVPTGVDDPNVVFADSFETEDFFDWVESEGLDPGIMSRNELNSDWWTKVDLRIEQELPGVKPGHKSAVFLAIENFTNLLNDDWGISKEVSFPRAQAAVDASINDAGQYEFQEFLNPRGQTRDAETSSWEVRVGFEYEF